MDAQPSRTPVPPHAPSPHDRDTLAPPLWRRLGSTVVILVAAVGAHVWLVRAPDPVPTNVTVAPAGSAAGPALAISPGRAAGRAPASLLPVSPRTPDRTAEAAPEPAPAPAASNGSVLADRHDVDTYAVRTRGTTGTSAPRSAPRSPPRFTRTAGTTAATFGRQTGTAAEPATPADGGSARADEHEEEGAAARPVSGMSRSSQDRIGIPENGAHVVTSLAAMAGPWTPPDWERAATATATPSPAADAEPAATELARQKAIVLQVLEQYAQAYERLDVQAAKAVWPTVNARELRRRFDQLDAQRLQLSGCGVSIDGRAANARCTGDATYQPKFGARRSQVASGKWNFDLSRHEDGWHIVGATATAN